MRIKTKATRYSKIYIPRNIKSVLSEQKNLWRPDRDIQDFFLEIDWENLKSTHKLCPKFNYPIIEIEGEID